jgi:hypothetical protein
LSHGATATAASNRWSTNDAGRSNHSARRGRARRGAAQPGAITLNDRNHELVERFVSKHVRKGRLATFRTALRSKLGPGVPGDAALRRAIALAALDIGIDRDVLTRLGLMSRSDGMERHRNVKTQDDDE